MTLKPPTNQLLFALPVSQLNEPSPLHNLTHHVLLWLFGDEPSAAERQKIEACAIQDGA